MVHMVPASPFLIGLIVTKKHHVFKKKIKFHLLQNHTLTTQSGPCARRTHNLTMSSLLQHCESWAIIACFWTPATNAEVQQWFSEAPPFWICWQQGMGGSFMAGRTEGWIREEMKGQIQVALACARFLSPLFPPVCPFFIHLIYLCHLYVMSIPFRQPGYHQEAYGEVKNIFPLPLSEPVCSTTIGCVIHLLGVTTSSPMVKDKIGLWS